MEWTTVSNIGYCGKLKDRISDFLTIQFGDNWRKAHTVKGKVISDDKALQIYEDSYYRKLIEEPELRQWLIETASDVYDNSPTNTDSGTDFKAQENDSTHLQDIAVRRVLARLGEKFEGDRLIEIRGKSSEGYALNPGKVSIYDPTLIKQPERTGWWDQGTIESFWQSNKVLQVSPGYIGSQITENQDPLKEVKFLDNIVLQFIDYQSEVPSFLGKAFVQGENPGASFVKIDAPYEGIELITTDEYLSRTIRNWENLDLFMRSGEQIPKGTLKKIGKLSKNLEYIS